MSTVDDNITMKCAACGKEGERLKKCVACKMVRYCNRECQAAHRCIHKEECKKRAAELHDEALFNNPPSPEDCPVCFLPLPWIAEGQNYMPCCGKNVCTGCMHGVAESNSRRFIICPFCRTDAPAWGKAVLKMINKRIEAGDSQAFHQLGSFYNDGSQGLPQDRNKAHELWHRAGELGYAEAYYSLGVAYFSGEGVEKDEKKANYFMELAAMGGDSTARHNLGCYELNTKRNYGRAAKHFMIAAADGNEGSLDMIRTFFMRGYVTKDDYAKALRAYQEGEEERKSDQRTAAAADHAFMRRCC